MDNIAFSRGATLTISSGAITVTQRNHIVAAETGTTDDLATITNGINFSDDTVEAQIRLQADTGDTITLKHGTGNIEVPGGVDFTLASDATVILEWDDFDSVWRVPSTIATATTIEGTNVLSTGEDDGEILIADGADGAAWGLQPLYLIGEVSLSGSAASMSVSSIPATYRHLQVRVLARGDNATVTNQYILAQFNGDTTAANYYTQTHFANAAADTIGEVLGAQSGIQCINTATLSSARANSWGRLNAEVLDYAGGTLKALTFTGGLLAALTTGSLVASYGFGQWDSVAAITQVTVVLQSGANFVSGSKMQVYGVK
jgi:hypothetical protein